MVCDKCKFQPISNIRSFENVSHHSSIKVVGISTASLLSYYITDTSITANIILSPLLGEKKLGVSVTQDPWKAGSRSHVSKFINPCVLVSNLNVCFMPCVCVFCNCTLSVSLLFV